MSDDTAHHPDADPLDELIGQLERAAEQLRSGELSADGAATLVEECAVLANRAGAELERRTRGGLAGDRAELDQPELGEHAPVPGQGSLL
jgi:hypothetical protein